MDVSKEDRCSECRREATWIAHGQFMGTIKYCLIHAEQSGLGFPDGDEQGSYVIWEEVKRQSPASS